MKYPLPIVLRWLLWPLALLYGAIVGVRNLLFEKGIYASFQFSNVNVIAVGNLTVGGTGKTPHVEYLVKKWADTYQVAILSRGYGRKTKGFLLADPSSTAETIGDEPMMYYMKFGSFVPVAVAEERLVGIASLISHRPDIQVVILDDAYQHRWVKPHFNILLTDYNKPFYTDFLLPAGRLREHRSGAQRAQAIVVSKVPEELPEAEFKSIKKQIASHAGKKVPIYFTGISYGLPLPLSSQAPFGAQNILLVTGIADPTVLVAYLENKYNIEEHFNYPDHYAYKESDILSWKRKTEKNQGVAILTTEKDMVKLKKPMFLELINAMPIYYIPIEIFFHEKWGKFDQAVNDNIQSQKRG